MTLSTYLLYLAAVVLLILTPGPTMIMCLTNAVNHGSMRAMASAAGALVASLCIMALSALGLGALLAASEAAFTVLKVAGGLYLIWLGVKTCRLGWNPSLGDGMRAEAGVAPQPTEAPSFATLFAQGFMVGASNPKAILFFAAFFPQFIDAAQPAVPQFLVLSLTFVFGDFLMLAACAFGVARIAHLLRRGGVMRWTNRVCGSLFALMGAVLLFSRRSA